MSNTITQIHKPEKFAHWLQQKGFAASGRERIQRLAENFALWCEKENIPLLEVTYNEMLSYMGYCRGRGIKPISAQKILIALKHYYSFLLSEKDIADNPCTNVEVRGIKRKQLHETFTPEELENIYRTYAAMSIGNSGMGSHITHKRNKVILGLIIYQGVRTQELADLKLKSLNLRDGKITIEGALKTEERELKLEAHQVYELMDYVNETRKLILAISGKETDKLFTSIGSSENFGNVMQKLMEQLRKLFPRLRDVKQLHASVITNWLKLYDVRKVQYMAGHRYVSSTEAYQVNNMDNLKEDVNRYHPDL